MKIKFVLFALLLTAVLTYVLYLYHEAQPPDLQKIERCNELVSTMPESTQEEINRALHAFHECLGN